jgi:CheY-like chemotaxis protein
LAKQNILIVDADPESVKVLEVSLKKVGYSVTTAQDGFSALEVIGFSVPDLVISDTRMPGIDGFEFCTKLKADEELARIPFIFLTADKSIENKIRGLELGVDDYLNKPIFIREILVRVNLAIQRRQKERLERRGTKSKFSGNLQDMGVVDLMQTIDLGHKSGVLHIARLNDDGNIYFRDGQVIDGSTRTRNGADAVYRMLVWSDGTFEIEFTNVERPERIRMSTQGLLMEGMRRLDEWGRLQEQLPPLTAVFDIDEKILAERLGEIPDEVNSVLKHFDGHATLLEVVDHGALGDLEALTLISKLYFEGLITEIHATPSENTLDPNAYLPEPKDSWAHSVQPGSVPSRVVDDAIGPHMSVAAQFPILTGSPTDPPTGRLPTPTPAPVPVVSVPAPVSDIPMSTPDLAVLTRPPVPDDSRPISTSEASARASESASDTSSEYEENALPTKETRTLRSRRITPDPQKIAEAIDAEVPPPDETQEEERPSSEPDFFEGAAYRASMGPRATYDPPPRRRSEMPSFSDTPRPVAAGKVDKLTMSSIPAPHSASEWPEDPPEVPKSHVPLIAAIVLLLAVSGVGAYWWLGRRPADTATSEKQSEQKAVAPKTSESHSVTGTSPDNHAASSKPALPQPPSTPANTPETVPTDEPSMGKVVPEDAIAPSAGTLDTLTPKAIPSIESPAAAATPPPPPSDPKAVVSGAGAASAGTAAEETAAPTSSATPPGKKVLSAEESKELKKLLDTVDNVGRKKKIEIYNKALEIDPTDDDVLAALSIELLETKATRPEALSHAEKAVAINPDNAAGWMAIGYIRQLEGKNEAAAAAYKRCAACKGPSKYTSECRRLSR